MRFPSQFRPRMPPPETESPENKPPERDVPNMAIIRRNERCLGPPTGGATQQAPPCGHGGQPPPHCGWGGQPQPQCGYGGQQGIPPVIVAPIVIPMPQPVPPGPAAPPTVLPTPSPAAAAGADGLAVSRAPTGPGCRSTGPSVPVPPHHVYMDSREAFDPASLRELLPANLPQHARDQINAILTQSLAPDAPDAFKAAHISFTTPADPKDPPEYCINFYK